MTVFLTSHTGGWTRSEGKRIPAPLIADNGFPEELRRRWPKSAHILFIAANPEGHEKNDSIRTAFLHAFPLSALSVADITLWDSRNEQDIGSLTDYHVIILSGGHVPTQNDFFRRIRLKERLKGFDGILIGISAGTMNCAETVYAHPEREGEAVDPDYQRFLPGLGLTKHMILPHYQMIKDDILDGLRVFRTSHTPTAWDGNFSS